jgi:hypothetical protein
MAVVGLPVNSEVVQALVVADALASSTEEDLEEGEPVRSYLSNSNAGYQLMHHRGRVSTAFLYAEPAEGFSAFPGPLPCGLPRGVGRNQVRAQLGVPERSGEPFTSTVLGLQGAWDRFAVDDIRVHFQYSEPEQRVRLVSVMAVTEAP